MSTFKERVAIIAKHYEIPITKMEEMCGTGRGILAKVSERSGIDIAVKILSTYPNISERWLVLGEGKMEKPNTYIAVGQDDLIELNSKIVDLRNQWNKIASESKIISIEEENEIMQSAIFTYKENETSLMAADSTEPYLAK